MPLFYCFTNCNILFYSSAHKSRARILVVTGSLQFAKELVVKLINVGYAISTNCAPSNNLKSYMHFTLENWPVILVTPLLFSGLSFGKLDLAIVFGEKQSLEDLFSLERHAALAGCNRTVVVFPHDDRGLQDLADAYTDFFHSFPVRI